MRKRTKKKIRFFLTLALIFAAIYFGGRMVVSGEKLVATPIESVREPVKDGIKQAVTLSISPEEIRQGDPGLIEIEGVKDISEVATLTFNNKALKVFQFNDKISALVGIDLRMKTGTYPLVLTLADGKTIKKDFIVSVRTIVKEQFSIPEKLGGNTVESESELISTLNDEGGIISAIPSGPLKLWDGPFQYPLAGSNEVTDTYGYSRLTATASLSHKGTDFRADIGTPVLAINSGKVSYTDFLRNYGNVIVIDHGLGLQSLYLHLSEVDVHVGDMITKGQLIGLSGDTGYVLGPHLHLSVRVGGISIDPEKFLDILGK